MSSVNMIVLSGNLGGPPEARASDLGKASCSFRLANNRWDGKAKAEVTDWYSVTAYGPVAESCLKYLTKGSSVVVEGRVALKEWEKDGRKSRTVDVIANRVSFFGSPRGATSSPSSHDEMPPASAEAVPF